MSVWQFLAATEGWRHVHAAQGEGESLSTAEQDELWDFMKGRDLVH